MICLRSNVDMHNCKVYVIKGAVKNFEMSELHFIIK